MTSEEDLKKLQDAAEQLGEFYDSVHIFATRHEAGQEGGTVNLNYGVGNWFARYGQVHEWLVKTNEYTKENVKRKPLQ